MDTSQILLYFQQNWLSQHLNDFNLPMNWEKQIFHWG